MRVPEWSVLGSALGGRRKVGPYRTEPIVELVGRSRWLFGFIGIKNRPSSDIGRELGGDSREFGRLLPSRISEPFAIVLREPPWWLWI